MEAIIAAIVAEMTHRSISYAIHKYLEMKGPTVEEKGLQDLQRLLLRTDVIVKEAEGGLITNRAMVHQLNIMRKEMYRGHFTMDSLRCQASDARGQDVVGHSFTLSKFNHAKRCIFSTNGSHRNDELLQVIQNLKNVIADAKEFIVFLKNYPPLYRQPYDMHLSIGNCMFGRQMEVERIMDFLMQEDHPSLSSVGILPIIGPGYVGKSTLVAHVYSDERVRNHFSRIVMINGDEIKYGGLNTLSDRGVIAHQSNAMGKNDRLLTIIEFSRNVDEVVWNSFYTSAGRALLGSGSKMIITSRSNTIVKFGTTQAVVLNFLPREAYWYFFKILTFESVDSNDNQKLERIAMEMARSMNGSFMGANMNSHVLRKKIVVEHWCMVLEGIKKYIQRNISLFGENPYNLVYKKVNLHFLES
ncbi:hypothetical protein HU200_027939 [Digitaria exilis]|uniref:NB-ARC domain-containing protein n=1 Tax=Digitaria exilis TaxID=1010633 RepID=A0A835ESX2_9POAL|nr:hypothetical protein HU200_027939 [Digitaria exilis]